MSKTSTERIIALLSVLRKYGLKKLANSVAKHYQPNYNNYRHKQVDVLVRGCLKTRLVLMQVLTKYLKKLPPTHILLVLYLALFEYFFLNTEEYAVLNEWVLLTPGKYKSLVNAVLRNCTRDYDRRNFKFNKNSMLPEIVNTYLELAGIESNDFVDDFLKVPPIFFITKTKLTPSFKVKEFLLEGNKYYYTRDTAILEKLKEYDIYIQDLAPQFIINRVLSFLSEKDELNILDMCSAPGGKSIKLSISGPKFQKLCLSEKNQYRMAELQSNLTRLDIKYTKIKIIDASIKNYPTVMKEECREPKGFKLVILDAPCSGLGTLKRHPEVLLRVNEESFRRYQKEQIKLLKNALKLVNTGGLLLYTVCSFSQEETIQVVEFIKSHFKIKLLEDAFVYKKNDNVASDIHYYAIFKNI